jgi:RNA polymerase sigma factor (sigma-70 family)
MTDRELLDRFAASAEPGAFDELVRRHLNLVYTAAQRQRPREADDVTQAVFLILAQKAGIVSRRSSVVGWLYRTTRYCCSNVKRTEDRRRQREREAAAMAAEIRLSGSSELLSLLDDAVGSLGQSEREAVLLRYLEAKSIDQTALELGISPAAAAKRASRGLEKLRMQFAKSGYGARAVGLEAAMSEEAAKAAPAVVGQMIQLAVQKGGAGISPTISSMMEGTKATMGRSRVALVAAIVAIFLVIVAIGIVVAIEWGSSSAPPQLAVNPTPNVDSTGLSLNTPGNRGFRAFIANAHAELNRVIFARDRHNIHLGPEKSLAKEVFFDPIAARRQLGVGEWGGLADFPQWRGIVRRLGKRRNEHASRGLVDLRGAGLAYPWLRERGANWINCGEMSAGNFNITGGVSGSFVNTNNEMCAGWVGSHSVVDFGEPACEIAGKYFPAKGDHQIVKRRGGRERVLDGWIQSKPGAKGIGGDLLTPNEFNRFQVACRANEFVGRCEWQCCDDNE